DWNWEKAQKDLKLLSELVGFRFRPYHEPSEAILLSGLMTQSKLSRFEQTGRQRGRTRAANIDYDPSIIRAALFLFDHLSRFKSNLLILNMSSLGSEQ
ncbi:hypothetical protein MJO29_014965, partial [Puccinia striiformis f. sp. tritici]